MYLALPRSSLRRKYLPCFRFREEKKRRSWPENFLALFLRHKAILERQNLWALKIHSQYTKWMQWRSRVAVTIIKEVKNTQPTSQVNANEGHAWISDRFDRSN